MGDGGSARRASAQVAARRDGVPAEFGVRGVVIGARSAIARKSESESESGRRGSCPIWDRLRGVAIYNYIDIVYNQAHKMKEQAVATDSRKWMQQGVATRPLREPSEVTCVTDLPQAVGAAYVPPAGFDCEPVIGRRGRKGCEGARERARRTVGVLASCLLALQRPRVDR